MRSEGRQSGKEDLFRQLQPSGLAWLTTPGLRRNKPFVEEAFADSDNDALTMTTALSILDLVCGTVFDRARDAFCPHFIDRGWAESIPGRSETSFGDSLEVYYRNPPFAQLNSEVAAGTAVEWSCFTKR